MKNSNKNTTAFFALLRAGLWEEDVRLSEYGEIDYSEVYRLASEQSVVGLIAADARGTGQWHGETIMKAPAAGFYSTPGMGMNQVRLAYVLNKKDIQRASFLLEKALEQFKSVEK